MTDRTPPAPAPGPLSTRRKAGLAFVFLMGIPLSYPTIAPLGVACAAILLFQPNKKARGAGLILVGLQISLMLILKYGMYAIAQFLNP